MTQTKIRRALSYGTLFAAGAIIFGLLYYFKAVKYLDLYYTVTYILYFVGVALLYNASYCKQKNHKTASRISSLVALLMIVASIVMLIYGFASGRIALIN